MRIISSKFIKDLDAATCEAQGITSLDLMERAAQEVVKELVIELTETSYGNHKVAVP